MLQAFEELKDFLKPEEVRVDGTLFKFHCQFTAVMLVAFSTILTLNQFIGEPIQCIVGEGVPEDPLNTYCWITSTFTFPSSAKRMGIESAHPGVSHENKDSTQKYHSYYQWVCFMLFFQAMACYAPKFLWDNSEGGLMKALVTGLDHYVFTEKDKCDKKETIVQYVLNHTKMHRTYALRYWSCELLCFVNILVQLFMIDKFFNGDFWNLGLQVLQISDNQDNRDDTLIKVFPRVTKCLFRKYGPSGQIQKHDALCVLAQNVVNEKTYILIWFWYLFLAFSLAILLVYRICLVVFPSLRPKLLKIRKRIASREDACIVTNNVDVGDWWLLYMLGKNLNPVVYNEVVVDLARNLENSDSILPNSKFR